MKLSFRPYELRLEYPFGISGYTRTTHTTILTEIEHEGIKGYGEGSPMRYLMETADTITSFLGNVSLNRFNNPEDIAAIMEYVDDIAPGNTSAKTSIDIALHDLLGKIRQKPCYSLFGTNPAMMPLTTLTIGIDTPEMVRKKVRGATQFKMIKVKLGSDNDRDIINAVTEETDVPICIDANQGWDNKEAALDMIFWLKEKGALFIEQPMNKNDHESNGWIADNSPLPVIADEAMQRFQDLDALKGVYHGINIKLVKCTGMLEAYKIIERARQLNMKVMIGCTSESSCAIMGAAALAPLCDWADLDAPWLITNNPYQTPELKEGKIILTDQPGLGITPQ